MMVPAFFVKKNILRTLEVCDPDVCPLKEDRHEYRKDSGNNQ